jgi:CelD/BcsL family acetyltransferase involved in cellulose biosynthesis
MSNVRTRLLSGFLDPQFHVDQWQQLVDQGETNTIFQTWHWLRAWWESMGKGDLLLIVAEHDARVVALAPLYAVEGMVYFVGSGESDYLDFIGDIGRADVLNALLAAARELAPCFLGFEFLQVPDSSRSGSRLQEAAQRLGLECVFLKEYPAVEVDLEQAAAVEASISRSMLKRETFFRRRGPVAIRQLTDSAEIRPFLQQFYAQHFNRWERKGQLSSFADPEQRAFLERFLEVAAETDWIRFLAIESEGRPLAFEFAWYYQGAHYSGPWCFAIEQANHSPGHVLLRQSVLAAMAAGLHTYDLGLGDQQYKLRFPARIKSCRSWGLYPP